MITRLAKITLVASIALLMTLVAFNNLTDYGSNLAFVQHVMSMDTTFPNNNGMWRAITTSFLHHVFYAVIIAWETISAVICWIGAIKCFQARKRDSVEFNHAKSVAISGLTLVLLLFTVVFLAVGGEWFMMWQSATWNSQSAAFRMIGTTGVVLIFLSLPDTEIAEIS
jgi:predicted small integral membrane protein